MDLFSQALFGWDYFAKIEAKMFAKQAKNFPEMFANYFQSDLTDSATNFIAGKSSSFADLLAKHNYMRKRYSIQEVFRRIFSGFSAILNVLQSCEVFANFCANYFAKKFLLQNFFINVRKCVQKKCVPNFCATMCKIIFANYLAQLLYCNFLLFLFTSFSCYCGIVLPILETLRFIFLKGLWNQKDMRHGTWRYRSMMLPYQMWQRGDLLSQESSGLILFLGFS